MHVLVCIEAFFGSLNIFWSCYWSSVPELFAIFSQHPFCLQLIKQPPNYW